MQHLLSQTTTGFILTPIFHNYNCNSFPPWYRNALHTISSISCHSRLDINECLEGTDACNRETQHCLNGRGNYTCQNKAVETCLPGFIYDSASKACEGLNIAFFRTTD